MTILAITPEEVATAGKAWVEAVAVVVSTIIAQIGILFLAGIAVYQNISKQLPHEFKERLDRYNDRLDRVALATVAAAPEEKKLDVAAAVARTPIQGETTPGDPIPVVIKQPESDPVVRTEETTSTEGKP